LALRSQLREAVRAAILDAAEELIATRGLSGAGLLMIARRAGVAVGTLYNYFADREALIRALFETRRAALRPKLHAAARVCEDLPFEPRLRRFMRELFEVFEAHRKFLAVAIESEAMKPSPSTTPQDVQAALAEIVAAGVAEGTVARAHAELLPLVLAGAIRAIVLRRIAEHKPFGDAADTVVAILLDGIRCAR
jgi:AcrR family transcriptional regulator